MDDSRPRIVRRSAREAAQRLLDAGLHPEDYPMRIPRAFMAAAREGTMMTEALVERLQSDSLLQRLAAALQILVSRRHTLLEVDSGAIKAAEQVYLDGLGDDDAEVRQATLMIMCNAPATEAVVNRLKQMWIGAEPHTSVYIAAALWTSESSDTETMRALTKAVEGDDIVLLRTAALALARNDVTAAMPVDRMIAVFAGADETMKQSLLFAFQELGPRAVQAKNLIDHIVADDESAPGLRKIAAIVLGSITRGINKDSPVLSKLLNSPDPELVRAALMGQMFAGHFSEELVRRIGALLSARNEGVRESAAMALCAAGSGAIESLSALIERIELEGSRAVLGYVFDALTSIGPPATAALIGIVRKADRKTHDVAAEALTQIGLDAALGLITELEKEVNDGVAVALMLVLEHSESDLTVAIERMVIFLQTTDDEQRALMLMMALAGARTVSPTVMSGVINWINKGSDELAVFCSRVCMNVGESAIPILKEARKTATQVGSARIGDLLKMINPQSIDDFRDLSTYPDQTALQVFLHVGRLLNDEGPLHLEAIEGALDKKKTAGLIPAEIPLRARSIQENLRRIKRGFPFIALSRRGSRKGFEMNAHSVAFLQRLERYFDRDT